MMYDEEPPPAPDEWASEDDLPIRLRVVGPDEQPENGPDPGVYASLQKTSRMKDGERIEGPPKANPLNCRLILNNDARWAGRLGFDEHLSAPIIEDGGRFRPMRDADLAALGIELADAYGIDFRHQDLDRTVMLVCREHPRHELRDWLSGLQWDGVARLEELWTRYFGCAVHRLTATYGVAYGVQAVARVLAPGCDAQAMVVLVGVQGRGKSRAVRALAGQTEAGRAYTTDLPEGRSVADVDSLMTMHGAWLVNADELEALQRSSIGAVKSWLTRTEDTYRSPYGRLPETHRRQSVVIGSTNRNSFLVDSSGSRRFWVMEVTDKIDVAAIARDREQLWAEAVAYYRQGVRWWLDEAQELARAQENDTWRVEGWHEADIAAMVSAAARDNARLFVHDVVEQIAERYGVHDRQQAAAKAKATLENLGCTWSKAKAKNPRTGVASRYYLAPPPVVG